MSILLIILVIPAVLFLLYWLFLSPYSQIFGHFPFKFRTTQKVIALTFDDGPNDPYTSQLLDFLNEKRAKATFFVVGDNVKKYPYLLTRMIQEGHSIGIHSANHKFRNYLLHPSFKEDITQTKDLLYKITGQKPQLFRPPWLWRHPLILKNLKKSDLKPVSGVFCSYLEIFKPCAKYIARSAIIKAKPGAIIIFHDGYNSSSTNRQKSIDATKIFVNELQKKGYKFIALNASLLN